MRKASFTKISIELNTSLWYLKKPETIKKRPEQQNKNRTYFLRNAIKLLMLMIYTPLKDVFKPNFDFDIKIF